MVAGGASGIVAISGDLGGDDRLVAFMQYARVLIIVALTPLLAGLAFPGHGVAGGRHVPHDPLLGSPQDWLVSAAIAPAGIFLGRLARLPSGALMGAML